MVKKGKILVTGAAGMIAFHTISHLIKDYDIVGIDYCNPEDPQQFCRSRLEHLHTLPGFSFISEDLCHSFKLSGLIEDYSLKGVIHLAATAGIKRSFEEPEYVLHNNQCSFLNVLDMVRVHNPQLPVIYASSSSVYGQHNSVKTAETHALNPISAYGVSKKSNEELAQLYQMQYGLNLTGMRFFTVYGEFNRQDMFIYKVMQSIQNQTEIPLYHSGQMQRDFTYVKDIAQILTLFMNRLIEGERLDFDLYNVGNGHPVKIIEVLRFLEHELGIQANSHMVDNHPSYDPLRTSCDNTRILNTLHTFSDFHFTSLEEGLKNTAQWFKTL